MNRFEDLSLPDRALVIADRVTKLVGEHLFPGPSGPLGIDYISIYSHNEGDYAALCGEAAKLGSVVFEKNGPAYQLRDGVDLALPADIVRVRQPDPIQTLEGCADMLVDDYVAIEDALKHSPSFLQELKDGYRIMRISDTDFAVAAYFPSDRITRRFMAAARVGSENLT